MKLILISDPSSIHTRNWMDGLQANGVDVEIIFIRSWILRKGPLPKSIAERTTLIDVPSFSRLSVSSFRERALGGLFRDLRHRTRMHQTIRFAGKRIKKIVEERNVDIIHAHGLASSIFLAHASEMKPYTASAWGSDIYLMPDKYPYLKPIMAKAISEAAFIHVESEISANRVKQLSSSEYSNLLVSTWGVNTTEYSPGVSVDGLTLEIPEKYILSFRSLEPLYQVDIIIDAFAILSKELDDVALVVGGDGSSREDLENLSKSHGLEERILFTGFVEANEKRALFSKALLYVQCPESDGVSLAMMEAMSSGLPLVSSNVGETSVLVKHEENGTLVVNPTPDNMARALLQILKNDTLRKMMGEKSRELALEHHDRSKFFQTFVKSAKALLEN